MKYRKNNLESNPSLNRQMIVDLNFRKDFREYEAAMAPGYDTYNYPLSGSRTIYDCTLLALRMQWFGRWLSQFCEFE